MLEESRGQQSLSWEHIELCNNGKCQLRARKGERRREKSRTVNKKSGHRSLNERLIGLLEVLPSRGVSELLHGVQFSDTIESLH